jgi:signal transduction histidine kinase/HAMP domain-containing protein
MKEKTGASVLSSIRTRFGLLTGLVILLMLLTFYLGGRYILVNLVREAEGNVQTVTTDIKKIICEEIFNLRKRTLQCVAKMAECPPEQHGQVMTRFLDADTVQVPVHVALLLDTQALFKIGFCQVPGSRQHAIDAGEVSHYFSQSSSMAQMVRENNHVTGVMLFRGKPIYASIEALRTAQGTLLGYLVLGTMLDNPSMIARFNTITRGISVSIPEKMRADPVHVKRTRLGSSLIFMHDRKFASGGTWHFGDNDFSVEMPLTDLLGNEIFSIDISLPGTISVVAHNAELWLVIFTACIGIVFVVPIFWAQSRMVLNPLTEISSRIQEIGTHHLDGDMDVIPWPKKDEFGLLVKSVNEMVAALAAKTKKIQREKEQQQAMIASVPDCLCSFDFEGRLIEIYKQPDAVEPIPGLRTGCPLSTPFFSAADCEKLKRAIRLAYAGGVQAVQISVNVKESMPRSFETRVCKKDHETALVVLRDVTREQNESEVRKQVETHLMRIEKMESLGTLAAGIAHDVNNILTIIQNTIDLTWDNPSLIEQDAIRTILQSTEKGAKLARELMTYAGQSQIQFKREDPNTFIRGIEKLMGGVVASNIILEFNLGQNLPSVELDPHQFWKVIINLLKNASEAMNGMGGAITLSTYSLTLNQSNMADFFSTHTLEEGSGVVFQIDDMGSGIPPRMLRRVFEPFFSTKAVGRGLGLATVFGIVDAHSGGIAISSEVGKGTSFRVWVPEAKAAPVALPVQNANASAATPADPQAKRSEPPLVLIVEDDPAIMQTTKILLRSMKVETLDASNKRDALASFHRFSEKIALVLLDAQMGHLDNVRLLAALRRSRVDIPVVIVSGHNENYVRQMFESQDFDGFLSKPYTRDELVQIIKKFTNWG